jgi:hypothetical protein
MITGIIIVIILLLIVWYARSCSENFEVWPIATPDKLMPTPPNVIIRKVSKNTPTGDGTVTESSDGYVSSEMYGDSGMYGGSGVYPGMYGGSGVYPGMYGGSGVYPGMYGGSGMYPGIYPGMYGGSGMYGSGMYSPLLTGGNTSGSASIGGFGPAMRSNLVTPSMYQAQTLSPSQAVTPTQTISAAPVAPADVATSAAGPMSIRASAIARETRARAVGEEADITGFDWSSAAAQSATAFEPTETVQYADTTEMEPINPFETVDAATLAARTSSGPNVTATTAVARPQDVVSALNEQKLMQASFGSVNLPGMFKGNSGSMFGGDGGSMFRDASANKPGNIFASAVSAIRGSRNQPGGGLPDSKSTQTIIDTAPGQIAVAPSIVQAAPQVQPVGTSVAVSGSSSLSA